MSLLRPLFLLQRWNEGRPVCETPGSVLVAAAWFDRLSLRWPKEANANTDSISMAGGCAFQLARVLGNAVASSVVAPFEAGYPQIRKALVASGYFDGGRRRGFCAGRRAMDVRRQNCEG